MTLPGQCCVRCAPPVHSCMAVRRSGRCSSGTSQSSSARQPSTTLPAHSPGATDGTEGLSSHWQCAHAGLHITPHHHLCMASCDPVSKVVPTEPVPLSYGIASLTFAPLLLYSTVPATVPWCCITHLWHHCFRTSPCPHWLCALIHAAPLCLPLLLQERQVPAAGQCQGEAARAAGDERWQQRRGSMDSQRAAGNTCGQGV